MPKKSIIILPGWKSSSEKWEKVKTILEEKGVKVLALDLPGFKKENKLAKPWTLDDYVEWVFQTKEARHIKEPFCLLGHSFGGRVAIKFALKYPQLLESLILVSSAGIKDKSFKTKLLSTIAQTGTKLGLNKCPLCKAARSLVLRKTDYLKTDNDLALKETMRLAVNEDLLPLLDKIKTKTLLIFGDKDKLTPLEQGKLMEERIPHSRLVVLKGAGHTPYLECPNLLAEKILS